MALFATEYHLLIGYHASPGRKEPEMKHADRHGREPRPEAQRQVTVARRDPPRCHTAMLGVAVQ